MNWVIEYTVPKPYYIHNMVFGAGKTVGPGV